VWSVENFMISSWSLMNALSPSPYNRGIFTSNSPRREKATSSMRVVFPLGSPWHLFCDRAPAPIAAVD
jgi:hypothetical protein